MKGKVCTSSKLPAPGRNKDFPGGKSLDHFSLEYLSKLESLCFLKRCSLKHMAKDLPLPYTPKHASTFPSLVTRWPANKNGAGICIRREMCKATHGCSANLSLVLSSCIQLNEKFDLSNGDIEMTGYFFPGQTLFEKVQDR